MDEQPRTEPKRPRATESAPFRTLDRAELNASLSREVSWLLNTRCAYAAEELEGLERTALEYGMPDFSNYHLASADDRKRLARAMREAIIAYEPRLARVAVEVVAPDGRNQGLTVAVAGMARRGPALLEPVSFTVKVNGAKSSTSLEGSADAPSG